MELDDRVYVASQLADALGLGPTDADAWIAEPNRLLEGDSPAARIEAGGLRSVLDLIEGLADGVVV